MENNENLSQLKDALFELNTVNSLIDRINKIRETNHIMSVVITELIKLTSANQGVINLVEPDVDENMVTIVRKAEKDKEGIPFKVDTAVSGWVLTNRQMLKIDDLDSDQRFTGLNSQGGKLKSILCFPMLSGGKILGLTSLVRDDKTGPFNEKHCRLAGIIVSQSAQILNNAILYEELARKNELLEISYNRLNEENLRLKNDLTSSFTFENIIGKSQPMKDIMTLCSKICSNDSPVLITGETGTGKELIARAIHFNSNRKENTLVVKNCGVKTESLLESELFGHVKGAFTGADREKQGLFKQADGGTIFLDEIGDAPLSTQSAILRVIETGEIRQIGSSKTEIVNVRVISATNRDLMKEIKQNRFRQDLYYRLNTFTVNMPSLKDRKEDIPLLVEHFLRNLALKLGKDQLSITPAALDILMKYHWPGNVRQLENEIERAIVVCEDEKTVDVSDLSSELLSFDFESGEHVKKTGRLKETVENLEKEIISNTLEKNENNIQKTSRILGLTRKGLKDKMKRYGLYSEGD